MHDAGNDTAGAPPQMTGGDAWMTYREIAAARGITHAAAIRLVQRHRWPKREGSNDGLAHVLVPHDAAQPTPPVRRPRHTDPASPSPAAPTPPVTPDPDLLAGALALLEDAVSALRDQLVQADTRTVDAVARADRAEVAIAEERERAGRLSAQVEALSAEVLRADAAKRDKERAEADRDAERARADALQGRIEALQEQLATRPEGVDVTEAIRQAEAMVHSFREAQAGEVNALKAERHRLATQIDGFATRADQAEGRTDSLRARVDVLQRERDTARAEAAQAAAVLRQAEAARKARGLVARLRAAWRGE